MSKILGMYEFALEAEPLPAKEQAVSMLHIALVVLRYVAQWTKKVIIYRTRTIISHGWNIFYPIIQCGL